MAVKKAPHALIVLFGACSQTMVVAQSGTSSFGSPAPKPSATLLEARAQEIKDSRPIDKDVQVAVDRLVDQLKLNPKVQTTVVAPCPPAPGPAPAGMGKQVLAISKQKYWAEQMPTYVKEAESELVKSANLSSSQKSALSLYVVPKFNQPGSNEKFETVVLPGCPAPAPSPAGAGAAPKVR